MAVRKQFFSGLSLGLIIGLMIAFNRKSMSQWQQCGKLGAVPGEGDPPPPMSQEYGNGHAPQNNHPVSGETTTKIEPKDQGSPSGVTNSSLICDLSNNLAHLQTEEADYPRQGVAGPMQADEMLAVFSIIRTSSVKRILEIGGFKGDSAWNFLEALRCKQDGDTSPVVYTVDLNPVKTWHDHPVKHKTFVKDATKLDFSDIDNEQVDAILLDCHAFYASQNIVRNMLDNKILSRNGFIFLHDTGLHKTMMGWSRKYQLNKNPPGWVHQPVERLLAQWIQMQDCSFQRISLHDDKRGSYPRHGLTIMQRRANLDVNDCSTGSKLERNRKHLYADYEPEDCLEVQRCSQGVNDTCPVEN